MRSRPLVDRPPLPSLPISPSLPAIRQALTNGHLVLGAPPGSGKTTLVPLALLEAGWLNGRKILMLEPRRAAARMAARRMASLLGEAVGNTVGYQVRFERRISAHTRIEVLTEGLLLRRLQHDPELSDTGLVIFDEFHERSLVADLSLALCLDSANALREDLRLLLMSASMDSEPLARHLNGKALSAEGRSHPVDIRHAVRDSSLHERTAHCQQQIMNALREQDQDILVFLPGKAEIHRLRQQLVETLPDSIDVLPLHGELDSRQQDNIISHSEGGPRRIILGTDIAETSLTIQNIGAVVDSGLQRKPVFDPNTGLNRLQTRAISQASALQRSGRAGRLGPGVAYRCWTQSRQQSLERHIQPEILEADLAPLMLELANWGVRDIGELQWLTTPPSAHVDQARALLQQLGALDRHGRISALGRQMVRLPAHPRLAKMLLTTPDPQLGADLAALLSERDPYRSQPGQAAPADLELRLHALQDHRSGRRNSDYDRSRLARIDRLAKDFLRQLPTDRERSEGSMSVGDCLATAFPDRLAIQRPGRQQAYLLRNGRGAALPDNDGLTGRPMLVAAAMDAKHKDGRIWLAAGIDQAVLEQRFAEDIHDERTLLWDADKGAVVAQQRRGLGALTLSTRAIAIAPDDDVTTVLINEIRRAGLGLFAQEDALRQWQNQLALLQRYKIDNAWPDVSDAALLRTLETWLPPYLTGVSTLKQLRRIDVLAALQAQMDWQTQQTLQTLLPRHYTTPAGSRRTIEYPAGLDPVLRVPLQEMLGEQNTPRIAGNRIPLTLHLLSPAGRPLQVTQDLAHFWRTAYRDVKKEMRGRYPKHHWPDDPATAAATRFPKRRRPG